MSRVTGERKVISAVQEICAVIAWEGRWVLSWLQSVRCWLHLPAAPSSGPNTTAYIPPLPSALDLRTQTYIFQYVCFTFLVAWFYVHFSGSNIRNLIFVQFDDTFTFLFDYFCVHLQSPCNPTNTAVNPVYPVYPVTTVANSAVVHTNKCTYLLSIECHFYTRECTCGGGFGFYVTYLFPLACWLVK